MRYKSICCSVLLLMLCSSIALAGTPVILEKGQGEYNLGHSLEILEDKAGEWTIEDITSEPVASRFVPGNSHAPNYGYTKSAYWVRVQIESRLSIEKDYLLEATFSLMDQIKFFQFRPGKAVIKKVAGDMYPFSQREIAHPHFIFKVPTRPGEKQWIYLRFQTKNSMQFPLFLWTPEKFTEETVSESYGLGLYYGILLVMVFYNFFVYFSMRDTGYIFYTLYICSFGFALMSVDGISYQYLWPEATWLVDRINILTMGAAVVLAYIFTQSFLKTKEYIPRVHNFIYGMIALTVILMIYSLLTGSIKYLLGSGLVFPVISFGSSLLCWKKGYKPARLFLLARFVLLIALLVMVLEKIGLIPITFWSENGVRIGSAIEIILLSLALADRINIYKAETLRIKNKYQNIFDNSVQGIFQATKEGQIVNANKAMANILGYQSIEEFQVSVTDPAHQMYVDYDDHVKLVRQLATQRMVHEFEVEVYNKNQQIIQVSMSGRTVQEKKGEQVLFEGIFEDVTEKKRVADALKNAKEEAEAASSAKTDFLMNMSHELKTPLNGTIAAAELISTVETKPELIKLQSTIKSSGLFLLKIVDQILDFTKSQDGKLELEELPFELDSTLAGIKTEFFYKGGRISLKSSFKIDPESIPNLLTGDQGRLVEILNHLLENAAKFTVNPPEAVIEVIALEKSPEDVLLQFSITDNGIGISEKDFEVIFQPFSQADTSSTRQFDGVGIGLSSCRLLVEMMGGKIQVESELDKGSTFSFTVLIKRQEMDGPFNMGLLDGAEGAGLSDENESLLEPEPGEVAPVIDALLDALLQSNPQGINTHVAEIRAYNIPNRTDLLQAIDDYEYEDAASILNGIKTEIENTD